MKTPSTKKPIGLAQRLSGEPPPGMLEDGNLDVVTRAMRVSPNNFDKKLSVHGHPPRKTK